MSLCVCAHEFRYLKRLEAPLELELKDAVNYPGPLQYNELPHKSLALCF